MQTNDNTNRLKTYKIKNHDSGKTYSVKAVSYTDAKMKYNEHILKDSLTMRKMIKDGWSAYTFKTGFRSDAFKQYLRDRGIYFESSQDGEYTHFEVKNADEAVDRRANEIVRQLKDSITEDATLNYIENYKGVKIYQNSDNKKYRGTLYTNRFMPIVSFEEKDLKTLKAKIDEARNKYIKKYGNLDSLTEDEFTTVMYGERKENGNKWSVETNNLEITKRELSGAGYKYIEHYVNKVRSSPYRYTVLYTKDSITEDSIKSYKIKNHDSGQTFRVNAVSYTDAIKKYNEHVLKDSITEDASSVQIPKSSKEFERVIREYHKKYGKILQVESMVYYFETGKYYMYNESTDYSFTSKRLSDSVEDASITKLVKTSKYLANKQSYSEYASVKIERRGGGYIAITGSKVNVEKFIKEHMSRGGLIEDATVEYEIGYVGEEWGVWSNRSSEWVAFGTKEKMTELAKRLNELEKKQRQDSITEDADIAQNDIKSSYLPEDANADNIQYLGFNEKRKLSFYGYGDRYFVHYDLEGRTEEIDKATVQKILKKNILGEIDENDLINKEPQAEEIVSDAFTGDTTVADKLIGNGEVHFRYKGGRVITGAWNKNKLNEHEISSILNKYNCKREQERWNDIVFSTRIGNEENLCKAFNEINPSYSVSELLSLHDSKERGDR